MKKLRFTTFYYILVLLILVSGIGIVSAGTDLTPAPEVVTGDLGFSGINQTVYSKPYSVGGIVDFHNLTVSGIQYSSGTIAIILFATGGPYGIDANAPAGQAVPFTAYASDYANTSAPVIGQGWLGYQRLFRPDGSELPCYFWMQFTDYDTQGLTGSQGIFLDFTGLYNFTVNLVSNSGSPQGTFVFSNFYGGSLTASGTYYVNKDISTTAHYMAVKPLGLGIGGNVTKTKGLSQAFIFDYTGSPLTSESTPTNNTFNFTVPQPEIMIGILSSHGEWYNSSILFAENTTVIPGIFNLTIQVINKAGAPVPGAHVSLLTSGGTLAGSTNSTGMISFTAVPGTAGAILDITAGGFPEYIETFTISSSGTKIITLSSPSVTVYLDVKDSTLGYYLNDLDIGIQNVSSGVWRNSSGRSGSLYFDSTGPNYEYPIAINDTIVLAASKTGYRSASQTVTIPYDKYLVTLNLVNLNGTAPSSGNFTAILGCTDMQDGKAIVGASMTLQELGRIAATNQAGVATFRNIAVGTYTVQVSATGYQSGVDSITGTDQETAMKNIRLVREGCSLSETGTLSCNGTVIHPGQTVTSNQSANEKASGGVTAFLDNIVTVGEIVLLLLGVWFVKKMFW